MLDKLKISQLRADTPHCDEQIFFTSAGCSPMPISVKNRMIEHIELESLVGGYAAAVRAQEEYESIYSRLAQFHGGMTEEFALFDCGTRAWDFIIYGYPFKPGDVILTATTEYHSNYLSMLHLQKAKGIEIHVIPNGPAGNVCIESLEAMLTPKVKMIALSHVPTNGGLVQPVKEIGEIARKHKIFFLLDACQSVGQMPVRLEELHYDALSGVSRKFLRGPRGIGYAFLRKEHFHNIEPAFIDGFSAEWLSQGSYKWRDDARKFETWEKNIAACLGFGEALRYALELDMQEVSSYVSELSNFFRSELKKISSIEVCDIGEHQCGIVSFHCQTLSSDKVTYLLGSKGINCGYSTRRSTLIDMDERGITDIVRPSIHYFNTQAECLKFCQEISRILKQ